MTPDKFQELLARAKKKAAETVEENKKAADAFISFDQQIARHQPDNFNLTKAGVSDESLDTDEGKDAAVDIIHDVISNQHFPNSSFDKPTEDSVKRDAGVARDISLNAKQQLFVTTALEGEDCCLIGAAGTGKTTVTGKAIKALMETGNLKPLGSSTKWLVATVPGVLICSFTRKAVNNIRRAVAANSPELVPHVLTLHKVLEFAPIFSEIVDPKDPTKMKKTMTFEPQKHQLNPLPSGLSLVIFEESSMIGTDLYNLYSAATPHRPQEIFIGDIRQLPPIFGPAILGFKMALLPVVELDEVYRQALLSPIIRLAHAVLSGDSHRFKPTVEVRKEIHPHLGKTVERKYVPSLEAFNEDGEHGSVKIQIWQKTLPEDIACNTTVQQFIAWEQTGYYQPNDDLLLCPFNKSFGTVELNKGIHQYLGRKRGAIVHEIIAGFNTHYFAIGDRVLYDKEDAFITDIKRNATYMGKSPRPPSVYLDRWGAYQQELSQDEVEKAEAEDQELSNEAVENFMATVIDTDDTERVNAASHEITIKFAYSEETTILSGASEVNNLIGGHAITVHKAQGSENRAIFFILHKSHAVMVQNELLYTGISRAREKLHIICEVDTFYKGVKAQKVKGNTLDEKIKFFQGKVEYKEMEAELEFLRKQQDTRRNLRRVKSDTSRELIQPNYDSFNTDTAFPDPSSDYGSLPTLEELAEITREKVRARLAALKRR